MSRYSTGDRHGDYEYEDRTHPIVEPMTAENKRAVPVWYSRATNEYKIDVDGSIVYFDTYEEVDAFIFHHMGPHAIAAVEFE